VPGGVCLPFVYLEWYRAQQLARPELSEAAKGWWRWQRSYGLGLAVMEQAQEHEPAQLYRRSATPGGLRVLRRLLRQALPREYRRTG
jgi:hypothetical protein